MNESAPLSAACVSWLQFCGHGWDILQSIKALCSSFYQVAELFFPAFRQIKCLACLWPFVNPVLLHVLSLNSHETKQRLLLWNYKCFCAWNGTGKKKKNLAEILCRSLFVRFWVIRLFMCTGTPRQWNNDMSLQVVCRIFLGFWRGLHGKVSNVVSLVNGWFWGLCKITSVRTLVPRYYLEALL